MPRSKRRAVAARAAAADFTKPKVKLGKRPRAANVLDGSKVSARKIFVPQQNKSLLCASQARSVPLQEALGRARHFNASARCTALSTIGRIFGAVGKHSGSQRDGVAKESCGDLTPDRCSSEAHQAPPEASLALRATLEALQDDEKSVRDTAVIAVLSIIRAMSSVQPFSHLISSQICAGLSHIRLEIRITSARFVSSVLSAGDFRVSDIFADGSVNPLPLLANLIPEVKTNKDKIDILTAIASLSTWTVEQETIFADGLKDCTHSDENRVVEPFYYHSYKLENASLKQDPMAELPLLKLDCGTAGHVVMEVCKLLLESEPWSQSVRSYSSTAVSNAAARALNAVVCDHSLQSGSVAGAVRRIVLSWADEMSEGKLERFGANIVMAELALALGEWGIAVKFLEQRYWAISSDVGACVGPKSMGRCRNLHSNFEGSRRDSLANGVPKCCKHHAEIKGLDDLSERVMKCAPTSELQVSMMKIWLCLRWLGLQQASEHCACRRLDRGGIALFRWILFFFFEGGKNESDTTITLDSLPSSRVTLENLVSELPKLAVDAVASKAIADGGQSPSTQAMDGVADDIFALVSEVCRVWSKSNLGLVQSVGSAVCSIAMTPGVFGVLSSAGSNHVVSALYYSGVALAPSVLSTLVYCGKARSVQLAERGISLAWAIESSLADETLGRILFGTGEQLGGANREKLALRALAAVLACALECLRSGCFGGDSAIDTDLSSCSFRLLLNACGRIGRRAGIDSSSILSILQSIGANREEAKSIGRIFGLQTLELKVQGRPLNELV